MASVITHSNRRESASRAACAPEVLDTNPGIPPLPSSSSARRDSAGSILSADRPPLPLQSPASPATAAAHPNGDASPEAERAGSLIGRNDGMRREWNFALDFHHKAARLSLQCSPQWEITFIDPEMIENAAKLDRDVAHCPLMPVVRYTDLSAVVSSGANKASNAANNAASGAQTSVGSAPLSTSLEELQRNSTSLGLTLDESDTADEWWVEKAKHVEAWYSHLSPDTTLATFCRDCVQHVLKDPLVVSVDGDSNVTSLRMGQKLACPFLLGGRHRGFHFRLRFYDRSQLMNDAAYAIGTLVNQRGYLFLVRCSDEEELEGYLRNLFLPYYTSPSRLGLDVEVGYNPVASAMLTEQQGLYGEMIYEDRDASVAFSLPMYPMRVRPDFSPAKTVGVGSIACMTLELGVFERVFDDAAVAAVTGMPKYKVNQVVLCLEVEDVTRMGYPKVLSTDQYSELKIKRLLEVFPDANLVSRQPTTVMLGGKAGRSYTATFSYEPMQCVAKAMLVITLMDGHGVTALYLTRLGGGAFDSYLYLYEQLLGGVRFLPPVSQQASLRLSRHRCPNVRLLDTDLALAYSDGTAAAVTPATAAQTTTEETDGETVQAESAGAEEASAAAAAPTTVAALMADLYGGGKRNKVLEKHLRLMREAANDGRVPGGAVVLQVPPALGGLPRHRVNSVAAPAAARRRTVNNKLSRCSLSSPADTAIPAAMIGDTQVSAATDDYADGRQAAVDCHQAPLPSLAVESLMGSVDYSAMPAAAAGGGAYGAAMADYFGNEDARPAVGVGRSSSIQRLGSASASSAATPAVVGGGVAGDAVSVTTDLDDISLHSESLISVSGIPRLEELRRHAQTLAAVTTAPGSSATEACGEAEAAARAGGAYSEKPLRGVEASGADAAASHHSSRRASMCSHATDCRPFQDPDGEAGGDGGAFREPGGGGGGPFSAASTPSSDHAADAQQARAPTLQSTRPSSHTASVNADAAAQQQDREASAAEEARIRQVLEGDSGSAAAAATDESTEATAADGGALAKQPYLVGPSLRDVYVRCCDLQHCRPNSYLLKRLPTDPGFTNSVEEIDLTSNYLGRNGFVAMLNLLEHLPRLQRVYFNDMSLDNTDVEHLCEALSRHTTITSVELKNNANITLPSTRFFTRMLRANPNIHRLCLEGTRIGEGVMAKLQQEATQGQARLQQQQQQTQSGSSAEDADTVSGGAQAELKNEEI